MDIEIFLYAKDCINDETKLQKCNLLIVSDSEVGHDVESCCIILVWMLEWKSGMEEVEQ